MYGIFKTAAASGMLPARPMLARSLGQGRTREGTIFFQGKSTESESWGAAKGVARLAVAACFRRVQAGPEEPGFP
jgi:hypothetical protein